MRRARTPELYADAAHHVLTRPSRELTGQALLCEDVLVEAGAEDLSRYSAAGGEADLQVDLFVDSVNPPALA
jgi:citronellol/citronellal dehydrogenase